MKRETNQKSGNMDGHIWRWRISGLSKREYCRREKISYWAFRDRIRRQSQADNSEKMIRLPKRMNPWAGDNESGIEIRVSNKISIEIRRGFDGELLREILSELRVVE